MYLDLDKAVVVGHSFGGATALSAGINDKRIKAICTLDPWLYPMNKDCFSGTVGPKVEKPLFILNTGSFHKMVS